MSAPGLEPESTRGPALASLPDDPQAHNWRIYFVGICACSGALIFGYNNSVIGGTISLESFHRDFKLPPLDTPEYSYLSANIISCQQGGSFFGSLMTFPLTERIGRRLALTVAAVFYVLGSALMTFSYGSIPMMYGGRFIGGLGIGSVSLLVPMYISEISPPDIRGFLVGMWEIGGQLAGMIGFWINYAVLKGVSGENSQQWMITLGLQLVPGGMLFLASLFILPESPRFHIKKFHPKKALKTLVWVRHLPADHPRIIEEMRAIQESVDRELVQAPSVFRMIRELFWKGNRNRLAIGIALMFCQNLTGINMMNFYSPTIFRSIGFTGSSVGLLAGGMWSLVKTTATILSLFFLVDRLGRRKLLMIGGVGVILVLFYVGGFVTAANIDPKQPGEKTAASWVAMVCLFLYAVSFCIGWNSVPWIYCAEIFPNRLRSLCVSITTSTQWVAMFGVARASPYMLVGIKGGAYFVYASFTVATLIWVTGWLPETKGVTLENMDSLFGVPATGGLEGQRQEAEKKADVKLVMISRSRSVE